MINANAAINIGYNNSTSQNKVVLSKPTTPITIGGSNITDNCPAGKVVMNISNNALQCIAMAGGSADFTALNNSLKAVNASFTKSNITVTNQIISLRASNLTIWTKINALLTSNTSIWTKINALLTSNTTSWNAILGLRASNLTKAKVGNCPAGQVVMNTTTGGVQCVTAGGGASHYLNSTTSTANPSIYGLVNITGTNANLSIGYSSVSAPTINKNPNVILYTPYKSDPPTNATDYSLYANPVKSIYGVTWMPTSGSDGSGAYYFPGTSVAINYSDVAEAKFTTNFSVIAWINVTEYASDYRMIVTKNHAGNAPGWELRVDVTTGLLSGSCGNGASFYTFSSNTQIPLGKWTHVAFTRGSTENNWTLYINGVADKSTINAQVASSTTDQLYVGRRYDSVANNMWFKGFIDDVILVDRALKKSEIATLYSGDKSILNITSGGVTHYYGLAGATDAFVCTSPNGRLYRKNTPCVGGGDNATLTTKISNTNTALQRSNITVNSLITTLNATAFNQINYTNINTTTTSNSVYTYPFYLTTHAGKRVSFECNILSWAKAATTGFNYNVTTSGFTASSLVIMGTQVGATGGNCGVIAVGAGTGNSLNCLSTASIAITPFNTQIYGSGLTTSAGWIKVGMKVENAVTDRVTALKGSWCRLFEK